MQISIRGHFLLWIRPSHEWTSQISEPYQSAHLSARIVIKQLTDASLRHRPALFTTHSPTESLRRFYSPPQTNSKRKETSLSKASQPQFIYNAICGGTRVTIGGNSAEIVPLMKTNWRNQGSFLLPSQEANPNNMKLPKPRFSFAQKGVRIRGKDNACMQKKEGQVRINTFQHKEQKASTDTIKTRYMLCC